MQKMHVLYAEDAQHTPASAPSRSKMHPVHCGTVTNQTNRKKPVAGIAILQQRSLVCRRLQKIHFARLMIAADMNMHAADR
jgi:hypothetical protein